MIKKIRQKHRTGCSVASIAMLLNISYEDALKALHPNHKPHQNVAGSLETILKALSFLGIGIIFHNNLWTQMGFEDRGFVDIRALRKPALLCLYLGRKNHAVIWDPETQKIQDPGRKRNLPVSYYQKRLTCAIELK